ncbi:MAG: fructose-1,6-bisphosphatase [Schwartzia sp. (in: firmicutes)]
MLEAQPSGGLAHRYLTLLRDTYPSPAAVRTRIIQLESRLVLPKGVEHFMSDLHGEYEAFTHILNNCSGVIREKVDYTFAASLTEEEKAEFCTLIYYPEEKIEQQRARRRADGEWYRENLIRLLDLSRLMAYKFPRETVEGFMPARFSHLILELMGTRPKADPAQSDYYHRLLDAVIETESAADLIVAFTILIKRMAVDRLHIVGDFFDRGARPDAILDKLLDHPRIDIQWGNHDILWMGAACGSDACIANVVRNSLRYQNTDVLEKGYAISLRPLTLFASHQYPEEPPIKAAERFISILMFKLEGQIIRRRPEFEMGARALLGCIDYEKAAITLEGKCYPLNQTYFPTIDPADPYALSDDEAAILADLRASFLESEPLCRHIDFLYRKGSVYKCCNNNLLFHACLPMAEDGSFAPIPLGGDYFFGRAAFDQAETIARRAYRERREEDLDAMWYFWCGRLSPFSGREFKTFERMFIDDKSTWDEPDDPYFQLIEDPTAGARILEEFGLDPESGHIINGHVPVKKGETPVKAGGKALVIDGGFCRAYHKKTGLSGFTLISNSRGLRLLAHQEIADIKTALRENRDIESVSETVELQAFRSTVGDTDEGAAIRAEIADLHALLAAYARGEVAPSEPSERHTYR